MRVSVVLLLFFLSCTELQKGDDQLSVQDVQPRLNRIQNQSHVERPELLTDQTTSQPDVWTELRELRDMVVEQRVQLTFAERQIEELKNENSAMNSRLLDGELQVEQMKQDISALEGRVNSTEQGVEALRKNANTPKVAFSFASGLFGHLGPVSSDTIMVFSKKITNIGNAFSPITGVFTAPVRGVYYFRFSILGNSNSYQVGAYLFRNVEKVIMASERVEGWNEYATSGAALLLEKEDLVYIKLSTTSKIFDDNSNHCTFSGFLVFPM